MSVLYHPDKVNVVADALSHMNMGSVSHITEANKDLVKDVHRLARLVSRPKSGRDWHPHLSSYVSEPTNLNLNISI